MKPGTFKNYRVTQTLLNGKTRTVYVTAWSELDARQAASKGDVASSYAELV